ncbi:hypothetical protein [Pedobacter sp. MW01-1-1]|uniref:hypothetical protein n=1 Tax=Pedobacter sp. MW01-1-1 TaxID=3383027 RepID=UPI003FF13477
MKELTFLLFIFLLIFSYNKKDTKSEIKFNNITQLQNKEVSIEIETKENFYAINKNLSFGFECIKNENDFNVSKEDLDKIIIINDIIKLNQERKSTYNFSTDESILEKIRENNCLYCRFTRPDFLFTKSYKSKVFKINAN